MQSQKLKNKKKVEKKVYTFIKCFSLNSLRYSLFFCAT
jgi:hypothetical protein